MALHKAITAELLELEVCGGGAGFGSDHLVWRTCVAVVCGLENSMNLVRVSATCFYARARDHTRFPSGAGL